MSQEFWGTNIWPLSKQYSERFGESYYNILNSIIKFCEKSYRCRFVLRLCVSLQCVGLDVTFLYFPYHHTPHGVLYVYHKPSQSIKSMVYMKEESANKFVSQNFFNLDLIYINYSIDISLFMYFP